MHTIAHLFDPRGGASVIRERCERCDDPLSREEGELDLCTTCLLEEIEEEDDDEGLEH